VHVFAPTQFVEHVLPPQLQAQAQLGLQLDGHVVPGHWQGQLQVYGFPS
jgi:hypothetical protein